MVTKAKRGGDSKPIKGEVAAATHKDVNLPIRLEGPQYERLRKMAFDRRESMRDIVVRALETHLKAEKY